MDLTISKESVFEEIGKTTAYIGQKSVEDAENSYRRIYTTNTDKDFLDRFWVEATSAITNLVKSFMVGGVSLDGDYSVNLDMPRNFDENLRDAICSHATSFVINYIIAKWSEIANKKEYEEYINNANMLLEQIKNMIFSKSRPKRR